MRRTYRRPGSGISGRNKKIVIGLVAAAVVGGGLAVGTGLSSASTSNPFCAGQDQAIQNNLKFIAEQRANPNAQTEAIIANRQAVIDQINLQKRAGGCGGAAAEVPVAQPTKAQPTTPPAATKPPAATTPPPADNGGGNAATGDVVCKGSTVTLSGEGGTAAASSGTFPLGTRLKVTNLDNNKSITVTVATTSGSCVLLNNAAFEEVREPGKFLIRRAVIERVG
ncbi:hypothetical protein [Actinoplanes derwentensis]|nr:hypothetical protein [Actinoplanes derwentensis]